MGGIKERSWAKDGALIRVRKNDINTTDLGTFTASNIGRSTGGRLVIA